MIENILEPMRSLGARNISSAPKSRRQGRSGCLLGRLVIPQAVSPSHMFPGVWLQAAESSSNEELHVANSGSKAAVGCGCGAPSGTGRVGTGSTTDKAMSCM